MSVRRNNRGKWAVDIEFRHPDGRTERVRRTSPVQTRRGAEQYEREIRAQLLAGTWGKPSAVVVPTVKVFSHEFMRTYAANNNKLSEVRSKRSILKHHILPAFGHLRLNDVGTRDVERYKAAKRKVGLADKTINNTLTVLRKMLRVAQEWEIIDAVPSMKQFKVADAAFDFLDFEEADRLVAGVLEEPFWHAMVVTAMRTGLRQGELLALEWDDVDLVAGKLHVRRRWYKGHLDTPKSGKSRTVPLSDDVKATLAAHRAATALRSKLVWCNTDGDHLTDNECKHPLRRARQRAGLRNHGWHVLRHTFASHLVMRGVPVAVVQRLMGHSDIRTTMRYAHLSPRIEREAVQLLDGPAPTLQRQHSGNRGGTRNTKTV